MRDAFIKKLIELAEINPRIMLITGDLGFGVLDGYAKRFPRQYLNVGVSEQNMTGMATGLALEGRIVFTYSIGNFPTLRCLEQIRNDACYHEANVKIVAVGGGFSYGALGISHHATEDLAIMRALPNMIVVAPGNQWEATHATEAIAKCAGTAFLRLDKAPNIKGQVESVPFRLGKARRLLEGSDITLVSAGSILSEAINAAEMLNDLQIRCRVVSMSTIKPLDFEELSAAASETGGIVSIEEHTVYGGLGGAIAESILESGVYPRAFLRLGLRAGFSSIVGSQAYLRKIYGLDASSIAASVMKLLKQQPCANTYYGLV